MNKVDRYGPPFFMGNIDNRCKLDTPISA